MTKEDKELLLKDLCARLPYGVIINCNGKNEMLYTVAERGFLEVNDRFLIEDCKPYLRSMSSMTREEENEYHMFLEFSYNDYDGTSTTCVDIHRVEEYLNWLNAHHFDFRRLIEKGLAIEAPEGMYKTK